MLKSEISLALPVSVRRFIVLRVWHFGVDRALMHDTLLQRVAVELDVLGVLDLVLFLRSDDAVLEGDVLCIIDTHTLADAVEADTVEEDVMHGQALQTGHVHCLAGVDASDVAEGEIAPLGVELALVVRVRGTAASGRAVCVSGLEEDSRFADILHRDVIAVDVLTPAATTGSGFETAADICAVEHTILDNQALHTAAEL